MNFQAPIEALRILGLSQNASKDDIKSAYRRMAAYYHPDAHMLDAAETTDAFLVIQNAYEYLMNYYDEALQTPSGLPGRQVGNISLQPQPMPAQRILGNQTTMMQQAANRHALQEHQKQERRLEQERRLRKQKFEDELHSMKNDAIYEEAMAKIHAIRAAEIAASIYEAMISGKL